MINKFSCGTINVSNESDLEKLFSFMKESVLKDTLNDKNKDFMLKSIDYIEKELKTSLSEISKFEEYKKKSVLFDKSLKIMSKAMVERLLLESL